MIYVIEGPDGTGKTTFSKALAMCVKKPHYMHMRYMPRLGTGYFAAALNRAIKLHNEGYTVIIDRWWPSAVVYDIVYREFEDNDMKAYTRLNEIFTAVGGRYIMCLPRDEEMYTTSMFELAAEREEMYDAKFDEVHLAYERLNIVLDSFAPLGVIRHDRFNDSIDTLVGALA